jgi:hypothetical protein
MPDAEPRRATVVLTTTRNTAWTEDGFRASWGKACRLDGIDGLTFHDQRGSAARGGDRHLAAAVPSG